MAPFRRSRRPKGTHRNAPLARGASDQTKTRTTLETQVSEDRPNRQKGKAKIRKPMLDLRPIGFLIRMTVRLISFVLGMLNPASKFLIQRIGPLINVLAALVVLIEIWDKVAWFTDRFFTTMAVFA